MNNIALKYAWLMRWNQDKEIKPNARVKTITPSWLRVDNAITFFISSSIVAERPAINMVILATTIITNNNMLWFNVKLNRTSKYTPAVTKVEEWTRADTGVGAAIAAGNQDEKGTCALFVIATNKINNRGQEYK